MVEWAGPADSEDPAPVVEVATSRPESTASEDTGHEPGEGTGAHDHGDGDHERGTDGEGNAAAPTGGSPVSPYLLVGIGGLAACAATAGLAVLRGRG